MKSPFLNKNLLCVALFFVLGLNASKAQDKSLYSQQQIENHIREVFADQADSLVFGKSVQRLKLITSFFNRISIKSVPEYRGKKFKLLSSLPLIDKYNRKLKRDAVFNPETFNALKYEFNIASKDKQIFRIDRTDYIIIISPLK